jgi:hypothetical protein
LSGFTKPARQFVPENPEDPMFRKAISEKRVVISVANDSGLAVEGLKPGNFVAYAESCDETHGCQFFDLSVPTFSGAPNFEEQKPGLYVIDFRISTLVGNNHSVFVKVFRTLTRAEILALRGGRPPNRQRAQIVLQ